MQIIKYYLLLLRQETKTGSEMTDYCGNIVYKDSSLAFILMPEGRIVIDTLNSSLLTFNYFLSDHLGNTRSVISQSGEVLEENAYYPFGMQINALSYSNTAPENRFLYNNKELTSDFGLDWYSLSRTCFGKYGARMYDAQIARFPSLDPKADEFAFVSPYNYAENRPIDGIDLWGLQYLSANAMQAFSCMMLGEQDEYDRIKNDQIEQQNKIGEETKNITEDVVKTTDEVLSNEAVQGGLNMVSGIISMIQGVTMAATGAGTVPGLLIFSYGAGQAGLGLAQFVDGIDVLAGGEDQDNPGGPAEMAGGFSDEITNNKNGTGRKIGEATDIAISLPIKASTIFEKTIKYSSIISNSSTTFKSFYNPLKIEKNK